MNGRGNFGLATSRLTVVSETFQIGKKAEEIVRESTTVPEPVASEAASHVV
jgi:hypothetical protein